MRHDVVVPYPGGLRGVIKFSFERKDSLLSVFQLAYCCYGFFLCLRTANHMFKNTFPTIIIPEDLDVIKRLLLWPELAEMESYCLFAPGTPIDS